MSSEASADLLDPWLGPGWKGWPHGAGAMRRSALGAMGWSVLRGELPLPLAVIRRDALAGNLAWMQRFARDHGVDIAPHGKTTMSPQLFAAQIDAGAWGITFANPTQARIGLAAGVRRCLIANQLLQDADLEAVAALRIRFGGARLPFLVDSPAQLELIEAWHRQHSDAAPFEVLLEIGLEGGRTGCRDHAQAMRLARRIRAGAATRLAGIECYEGLWASGRDDEDRVLVEALLQRAAAVARECEREALFECDEVLFSAGGSSIFDLVAPGLKPALSLPVRGVLRSGCYVTHDHGSYRRYMQAMSRRLGCAPGLHAAMEVWAMVQSCPEPGLAILGAGKRDLSYDIEMPLPVWWCRRGEASPVAAGAEWKIDKLNDQHAYLRWPAGTQPAPQVGDRIGLGISHPCTTFDKWRWMALVNERYDVVDAITTCF